MRRAAPFLIIVIGVLALFFVFWPNVRVPVIGDTTGTAEPRKLTWVLGLDLQGGFRVEYQAQPVDGKAPTADDMNTIQQILERRVNSTGVSEPVVQTEGTDRIVVELPGVQDSAAIEQLVGSTGRLDFVPLPADRFGNVTSNNGEGRRASSTGQPIPPPALQPLFSGDQVASVTRAPTTSAAGPSRSPSSRTARGSSPTTPRRTSVSTSPSSSTTRSSPRRRSRARSPTAAGSSPAGPAVSRRPT
jgi:preprotein translocase subunit SecD